MFCKNCGKQVSEDSNYCPYCGSYLMDNNINSKEDDPRVSNSNLFHTVNPINNNSNNKSNINNLLHPKLTNRQKLNNILSIINSVISYIAIFLMFFMFAFISNFIHFESNKYPFVLGIVIPIIICLFVSASINTYFLVLIIKYKIKIFRMMTFRVVTMILELSSFILLSIMLATIKPSKDINIIMIVSLAFTLFAIVMSWTTTMLNNKLKMFIK